jgi:hypothetical protein
MNSTINKAFLSLKSFCEKENFKGWDPYDGLNSKIFKTLHLDKLRLFRLAWIQLFKRNPVNLRRLLLVPKQYNAKGLALFLTGYCNLYKADPQKDYLDKINFLANKLIHLKSKGFSGACWGYNFDWQSRAFYLPKNTPTVVVTSFAASALMDAYDVTKIKIYLETALTSADFIMKDLHRTKKNKGFIFSYSPFDKTCVYNASLLGSKLLARAYSYNKDKALIKAAKGSIFACANIQRKDGAWIYGELNIQNWVDSFHTGYNLECIYEYQKYSGDLSFQSHLNRGLSYYLENFFLEDGTPKYYDNKTYPIDIHAPAQFMATLYKLELLDENKNLVDKVLNWTVKNMQDPHDGYFYYQLKKGIASKIPYMRWAQAWMFYGLSFMLLDKVND